MNLFITIFPLNSLGITADIHYILRADIESTEGRLRYLNKQVSFSTLDITFYDHNPNIGFANKFTNGLKNGWNNLLWVMVALANLWAIIFAIIIVWVVAVVASKRRKKRNSHQNKNQQKPTYQNHKK